MPRTLTRLTASALIPALLFDPLTTRAMAASSQSGRDPSASEARSVFAEQAVTAALANVLDNWGGKAKITTFRRGVVRDFAIGGNHSDVLTREGAEQFNEAGAIGPTIDDFVQDIEREKGIKISRRPEDNRWDLRAAVREHGEIRLASGSVLRLQDVQIPVTVGGVSQGHLRVGGRREILTFQVLVVIDGRFRADHAGRNEFAAYAGDEAMAAHEVAELAAVAEFALNTRAAGDIRIAAEADIREGRLGTRLIEWMNPPDELLNLERAQWLQDKKKEWHLAGLQAEMLVRHPELQALDGRDWSLIWDSFQLVNKDAADEWHKILAELDFQSETNRRWGLYFYKGRYWRPGGDFIVFEYASLPVIDEKFPEPGRRYLAEGDIRLVWRELPLRESPPTRILVKGSAASLKQVKSLIQGLGLDIPVAYLSPRAVRKEAYYHSRELTWGLETLRAGTIRSQGDAGGLDYIGVRLAGRLFGQSTLDMLTLEQLQVIQKVTADFVRRVRTIPKAISPGTLWAVQGLRDFAIHGAPGAPHGPLTIQDALASVSAAHTSGTIVREKNHIAEMLDRLATLVPKGKRLMVLGAGIGNTVSRATLENPDFSGVDMADLNSSIVLKGLSARGVFPTPSSHVRVLSEDLSMLSDAFYGAVNQIAGSGTADAAMTRFIALLRDGKLDGKPVPRFRDKPGGLAERQGSMIDSTFLIRQLGVYFTAAYLELLKSRFPKDSAAIERKIHSSEYNDAYQRFEASLLNRHIRLLEQLAAPGGLIHLVSDIGIVNEATLAEMGRKWTPEEFQNKMLNWMISDAGLDRRPDPDFEDFLESARSPSRSPGLLKAYHQYMPYLHQLTKDSGLRIVGIACTLLKAAGGYSIEEIVLLRKDPPPMDAPARTASGAGTLAVLVAAAMAMLAAHSPIFHSKVQTLSSRQILTAA